MKKTFALTCLVAATFLGPVIALAADDADADRSHPKAFVKDSAITTKIKSKLAAEHITSLGHIHVDTDNHGVVHLTGSARSQEAIDKAVSIARETENVKSVKNELVVKADDSWVSVLIDQERCLIHLFSFHPLKELADEKAKLALANRMNSTFDYAQFHIASPVRLVADYALPFDQGLGSFQLVGTLRRFVSSISAAIRTCDDEDVLGTSP